MEKKQCKRCLLREFNKEAYMNNIYEYISNMDEDIKAENTLYENRLATCEKCDYLLEGMCRACGCYVELRAAIANNTCPYSKW